MSKKRDRRIFHRGGAKSAETDLTAGDDGNGPADPNVHNSREEFIKPVRNQLRTGCGHLHDVSALKSYIRRLSPFDLIQIGRKKGLLSAFFAPDNLHACRVRGIKRS